MSLQLCLNCWVLGEKADRVFTVEIADTKNVSALKDAIKEKKRPAFDHIPADVLDLWQVRVHCFDASMSTPELWQVDVPVDDSALRNVSLDGDNPLLSVKRLSGLFGELDPTEERVHIVIQCPPKGVFRHLPPRIL